MAEYIAREMAIEDAREALRNAMSNGQAQFAAALWVLDALENIPAEDVVPVVRCKDCVYSRELTLNEKRVYFQGVVICTNPEVTDGIACGRFGSDFCSEGVRKEAPNGGDTD